MVQEIMDHLVGRGIEVGVGGDGRGKVTGTDHVGKPRDMRRICWECLEMIRGEVRGGSRRYMGS